MEIVIMLFVLIGGSIAFSAWKNNMLPTRMQPAGKMDKPDDAGGIRTCLSCGYEGEMKTWIANYTLPKVITVAGFLLGYLPGLIFLGMYWGKYRCPNCKSIGKSRQITDVQP